MRRALALFWLLGLLPCLAAAQAYTAVTATGVTVDNGSGTAVNPPSGSQLCFLGVNNQGAAVTYTPSGGSPVSGTVCGTLNGSGALTASLQVANPATASPLGLLYTITVVHSSTTYLTIPMVSLSGSLFSYDAFALPGTATATGIGKAHLACSNGAQWTSTTLSPGNQRCNSSGLWDSYPPALYCPSGQAYVVPQQGGTAFCISPSLEGDGAPSGTCVEKSTYLDISSTDFYACKNAAWALIGSGSGSVVSSINGASGSFTFSGSGVSCTSTTCTFGGGSVTWPTSGKAVISNGTNTPNGVAEVDGDCLLGVSGAWATGSCGGGGGGVQYNTSTATYAVIGSSVVADDTNSLSPQITAGSWSCSGTTCTVNTTAAHNLSVGSVVNVSSLTGWFSTPASFDGLDYGVGTFYVASVPSSTQFTFAYTANTGSGTGGWISDATYWASYKISTEPFTNFNAGRGTTQFYCGATCRLTQLDANFSTILGGVTGSPKYLIIEGGQNDIGGDCDSLSTMESTISDIWTKAHTAGFLVVQPTITTANWVLPSCNPWQTMALFNWWIASQAKSQANLSSGAYWDIPAALPNDFVRGMNGATGNQFYASNGGYKGGGAADFAKTINAALATQDGVAFGDTLIWPSDSFGSYYVMAHNTGGSGGGWNWYDAQSTPVSVFSIDLSHDLVNILRLQAVGSLPHLIENTDNNTAFSLKILMPNLNTGGSTTNNVLIGHDDSTGNGAITGFSYNNSNSASNYGFLDFDGGTGTAAEWFADGSIILPAVASSPTTSPICPNGTGGRLTTSGCAGGTSVNVNGSAVSSPNFNGTTPAAPSGAINNTYQVSTSSVSSYTPAATGSTPGVIKPDGTTCTVTSGVLTCTGSSGSTSLPICADTSGSGTAQSCTTSPSFSPVAGSVIVYTTSTANTGTGLTINVNSLGAKSVAKWQTTTTLAANDLLANTYVLMTYDGTNWELSTIGNAPSGGGSYPAAVTATASTSSELDFTTCLSSSYKRYQISFTDLVLSSDNNEVRLQFSGDGGSTYDSTAAHYPYNHSYTQINTGTGGNGNATTAAGFSVSLGTSLYTSVNPFEASFSFQNPNSALPKSFFGAITAAFGSTTAIYNGNGGGIYSQTSTVNAFRVIPNSGTITSGSVTCQPLPQ